MKNMFTRALALTAIVAAGATAVPAQTIGNESYPQLDGSLLDFNLRSPGQKIRIGGYLQTDGYYEKTKGNDGEYGFNVEHAMFSVQGDFSKQKLGFFLQADFTESNPLMDAWVSYSPWKVFKITAGQKQTFTNTRQMMMLDQGLAFGERTLLNQDFCRSGRELGLYLESRLPAGKTGFDLGVAVTSGDGRNSFGASSTDPDGGGLKYGGRVSFYPLGFFTPGNELVFNDFVREKTPKLAIGAAISYNDGTSNAVGEGHNDFTMYDREGKVTLPDYRKYSADILFKYNGFSFLAEYTKASACGLEHLYTEQSVNSRLRPGQIADYLALGQGFDLQAGYVFSSLWALDASYSYVKPEFDRRASVLKKTDNFMLGVSKYFNKNSLKIQLAGGYTDYSDMEGDGSNELRAMLNVHLIF